MPGAIVACLTLYVPFLMVVYHYYWKLKEKLMEVVICSNIILFYMYVLLLHEGLWWSKSGTQMEFKFQAFYFAISFSSSVTLTIWHHTTLRT